MQPHAPFANRAADAGLRGPSFDTAPAGEYLVWVQVHSIVPGGTRLGLRLQLLHDKQVFWSREGELESNDGVFGPYLYRFPGDAAATLFPGPVYPPPCGKFRLPQDPTGEVESRVGRPHP